jgi:hypothetical protein
MLSMSPWVQMWKSPGKQWQQQQQQQQQHNIPIAEALDEVVLKAAQALVGPLSGEWGAVPTVAVAVASEAFGTRKQMLPEVDAGTIRGLVPLQQARQFLRNLKDLGIEITAEGEIARGSA